MSASDAAQANTIKQSSIPTCLTNASRANTRAITQHPDRTVNATAVAAKDVRLAILVALPCIEVHPVEEDKWIYQYDIVLVSSVVLRFWNCGSISRKMEIT